MRSVLFILVLFCTFVSVIGLRESHARPPLATPKSKPYHRNIGADVKTTPNSHVIRTEATSHFQYSLHSCIFKGRPWLLCFCAYVCRCPRMQALLVQWSAVTVSAVTVTVGYGDSFCNPWFITNKTPLLTVTYNRLQWHLLPHFFRFLRHHMSKLTPEIAWDYILGHISATCWWILLQYG